MTYYPYLQNRSKQKLDFSDESFFDSIAQLGERFSKDKFEKK
jgi:hypothetical protein